MAFTKGHKKKGGRGIGTPNDTTKETREILQKIVSSELKNLPEYIAAITKPELKAKLIIDLLPFILPKYQNVYLESDGEKPIVILPSWLNESPEGSTL